LALVTERPAVQGPTEDLEELPGPPVPLVVREPVAVGTLLDRVAPGDDVDDEPPPGQSLERARLVRGQRGGDEPGAEGDDELQPLGVLGERRGEDPGVLAAGAGGRQGGLEAG